MFASLLFPLSCQLTLAKVFWYSAGQEKLGSHRVMSNLSGQFLNLFSQEALAFRALGNCVVQPRHPVKHNLDKLGISSNTASCVCSSFCFLDNLSSGAMASTSKTASPTPSPRGVAGGVVAATCDGEGGCLSPSSAGKDDPSPEFPRGGDGVFPRASNCSATAGVPGTLGTAGAAGALAFGSTTSAASRTLPIAGTLQKV